MSSEINILDLSDEILCKVFLNLKFSDKKQAALVCKEFLRILNSPVLMKNFCLRVFATKSSSAESSRVTSSLDAIALFSKTMRPYPGIVYEYGLLNHNNMSFQLITALRYSLTSLDLFFVVEIEDKNFAALLRQLPKLEKLNLCAVNTVAWKAQVFANIVSTIRYFHWQCYLANDVVLALTSAMPKLETLIFYGGFMDLSFGQTLPRYLTAKNLQQILVSKAETLKSICFKKTDIAPKLFEVRAPLKLETLELNRVDTSNGRLNRFLKSQSTLKCISLEHCWFDDNTLKIISGFQLEALQLNSSTGLVTDVGIMAVKSIKTLTTLCLTNLPLTDQGFNLSVMQMPLQQLTVLKLFYMENISSSLFERLINGTCNLQKLTIHSNPKFMTNTNLQLIFQKSLNLTHLCVGGSEKISDAGFLGNYSINQLKQLVELYLDSLVNITDKTAASIACTTLKKLAVSNCPKITVIGLKTMIQQCPFLEDIQITKMPQIPKKAGLRTFCKTNLKRFQVLCIRMTTSAKQDSIHN